MSKTIKGASKGFFLFEFLVSVVLMSVLLPVMSLLVINITKQFSGFQAMLAANQDLVYVANFIYGLSDEAISIRGSESQAWLEFESIDDEGVLVTKRILKQAKGIKLFLIKEGKSRGFHSYLSQADLCDTFQVTKHQELGYSLTLACQYQLGGRLFLRAGR